jgi:hypothetical protein
MVLMHYEAAPSRSGGKGKKSARSRS